MDQCFPPVTRPDTRLLVLGSLPGVASLAAGRYYAHPRNLFWRLIGELIGSELEPLPYGARLKTLLDARVGLWDTVAEATRPGSMDADIHLHRRSDLVTLAGTLPELRAIAFNGKTSARIGRAALGENTQLTLIDLPSSSPAYASLTYARKAEVWAALRRFL